MIRNNNGKINPALRMHTRAATSIICIGCLVTDILLPTDDPNAVFRTAAFIIGPVLAVALVVEVRSGFRALLRADILMLVALYGLTLFEFLLPQQSLSEILSPRTAITGTEAVLWGFAGIAIGRHLMPSRRAAYREIKRRDLSPGALFTVFLGCFFIGYLHMFLSVNFDVMEVLVQMTYPRFTQAWTRGQFGDWAALLTELGLLTYLLPPIAGLVFARHEEYRVSQKLVVFIILAFTLFYGFSSGTRNLFIIFVLTFASGYLIFKKNLKIWQILVYGAGVTVVTLMAVYFMLEFRTVGLANYSIVESKSNTLFVDNNIIVISKLTEVFPDSVAFLGLEVPFQALTKPIPRAIWPDKPIGLSFGPEEALGAKGLTIASTFIGESYMAGGFLGIVMTSILLGAIAGWWNRRRHDLDSDFKLLLYVSGFFAAALSMRSILEVVPATLPTLALWVYGKIRLPKLVRSRKLPVGAPEIQVTHHGKL